MACLVHHFFTRKRQYDDISVSIQEHLDERIDELMEEGMSRDEAERTARRDFGNVTLLQERSREVWQWQRLESLLVDLKHVCRRLRRSPGFAITVVLTLAIGIGANTAVFSVLNSVLIRPLPYPEPQQLVSMRLNAPGAPGLADFRDELRLSASMYLTFAAHNRAFQSVGVWVPGTASITGIAQPEQVNTAMISDGVLQTLDVPAAAGQWLTARDQDPRGAQRVMLSYGYWQRRFGGDPSVVGRTISVDSQTREIAGVMPRGFRVVNYDFDLLAPVVFDPVKQQLAGFAIPRYRAAPARRYDLAGQRRCGASAHGLDGLVDEWSRHRSLHLSDLEDHACASAFEGESGRQRRQRAVGGDGDDRRGDADRVHQCGQPAAGPSRFTPAGACGARGARSRQMADCPRATAGERDAWPVRRRSWRRSCVCGTVPVDGDWAGESAASERDLTRRPIARLHPDPICALRVVVRLYSDPALHSFTASCAAAWCNTNSKREPRAAARTRSAGRGAGSDGVWCCSSVPC